MNTAFKVRVPYYKKLIETAQLSDWAETEVNQVAIRVRENIERYTVVSLATGCPIYWIAAIHAMECGLNFSKHLANGDPISAPTVNVPVGIPAGTWEECAIAALRLKSYSPEVDRDWLDKTKWLWRAEEYNGWGYCLYHDDINTPYLWSGTQHYSKGKYIADGSYDPSAVSRQVGCFAIWQALDQFTPSSEPTDNIVHNQTIQLKVDTWVKTVPELSATISSDEKRSYPEGTELVMTTRYPDDAGHYCFETSNSRGQKLYVWSEHAIITGKDDQEAYRPKIEHTDLLAVQKNLIRIGLLDPPADGKWGSLSASAWRAFERVNKGDGDGKIDAALMDRLAEWPSFADLDYRPGDPNDPECLIATQCIKHMVALGAHISISMGSDAPAYNIFHVTGTNPDGTKNDNAINRWNDLRFVVEISQSGKVTVKLCKVATCEPGRHWIDNPMNQGGTFRIQYDKQWFAWTVGRHGSKQYPALVQSAEIGGYRDSDRDGSWAGESLMSGDYMGVNIHHGYDSDFVGQMSAGCQVAKSIAGHELFMDLAQSDRRYRANNGYLFGNISLDGSKI